MANEIEFSVMGTNAEHIKPLAKQFRNETGIRVRLRELAWDTAWSDLIKVALYSDGPDVSEIGSTWLGDLVAMNALVPLTRDELVRIGMPASFLAPAWQGAHLAQQPEVWALPWFIGARLVFYRRSLLARAGLDPDHAFTTAGQFEKTLAQLQEAEVPVPWTVPTGLTHTTFLNVASWVWAAGGEFVTPDAKQTLFSQPEAQRGVSDYFALARFLAEPVRHLNGLEPDAQFLLHADTAVTLSGSWLFEQASAELRKDLGVALPPGASFVGGSYLVRWKHSAEPDAALEWIRFLLRTASQIQYVPRVGLLPVTRDALAQPPYVNDPFWQTTLRGVQTGRAFTVTRSWGLMEDRLVNAFAALWRQILADPALDLAAAIRKQLEPLAKRLDLVLGQT